MMMHDADRRFRIALLERVENLDMFVDGAVRGMRTRIKGQREAAAAAYFQNIADQDRTSRHLRENRVKLRRKPHRDRLTRVAGRAFLLDVLAQRGDLFLGEIAGKTG